MPLTFPLRSGSHALPFLAAGACDGLLLYYLTLYSFHWSRVFASLRYRTALKTSLSLPRWRPVPSESPTYFRPGEIMEQQWTSQAWLAVPIQTWMNALPMVGQGDTNVPASEPPVRRHRTPTRERDAIRCEGGTSEAFPTR
jgi:hypothetical protein